MDMILVVKHPLRPLLKLLMAVRMLLPLSFNSLLVLLMLKASLPVVLLSVHLLLLLLLMHPLKRKHLSKNQLLLSLKMKAKYLRM